MIFAGFSDILVKPVRRCEFICCVDRVEFNLHMTMLEDIIASGECYSISQLAIKENDLITHRLVANKAQARAVIESLYEAVLAEPSLNVAPILLDMVRKSVRR